MMESNFRQPFLQQLYGRLQPGLAALAGPALEVLGQTAEGGKLLAQSCCGILLLAGGRRRGEKDFGAMKDLGCVLG